MLMEITWHAHVRLHKIMLMWDYITLCSCEITWHYAHGVKLGEGLETRLGSVELLSAVRSERSLELEVDWLCFSWTPVSVGSEYSQVESMLHPRICTTKMLQTPLQCLRTQSFPNPFHQMPFSPANLMSLSCSLCVLISLTDWNCDPHSHHPMCGMTP